jgi:predicted secreted protein
MRINKVLCLLFIALACCAAGLQAGDTASFVDLGFSPDGKVYMFAQYGVQSVTLKPWADLFAVDVPRNNFVEGGKVSYLHDRPVSAGADGSGALYRLIAKNAALAAQYGVDFLIQGQPLYIALNGDPQEGGAGDPPGGESIEFRDFEGGFSYRASLRPLVEGSGAQLTSSFYINLERTSPEGSRKNYTVGTPQVKRPRIASYRIRKVMIAPRDGSMIFVVEMKKQEKDGADIRYMVEAVRLY